MAIITISRQLGSLGNDIAQGLAEELRYNFLTRDIISTMLTESGYVEEEGIDTASTERRPSFLSSFTIDRDRFICYIKKVIYEFAQKRDVIIMGMGGQLLFQDFLNTLRVRIIAPMAVRIKRIQEERNCHERYAGNILDESDSARSGFNKYFFNIDWEEIDFYDLIINTSAISLQGAIGLLKEEIRDIDREEQWEEVDSILKELVLKQKVLIRILYEEKIILSYLNVQIQDGIVTLTGFSNEEEDKERCESAVRSVSGVKDVVNEILIEPSAFG